MKIRQANPEDARSCASVHIESWKVAYRGLVPDSYLDDLDFLAREESFRQIYTRQPEDNFLVEENGQVIGILTIGECRDDDLEMACTGEIWGIYLHPEHWRKGVGRILCNFALRELLERSYEEVVLWVFEGNEYARKFSEAMGFSADGASKTLEPGARLKAIRYHRRIP